MNSAALLIVLAIIALALALGAAIGRRIVMVQRRYDAFHAAYVSRRKADGAGTASTTERQQEPREDQ